MTTMNTKSSSSSSSSIERESMDEMVMTGLMEILVRRLSMVFGKEESEVRGAVGEEMAGLEAGYKKWLSAMSGVAPKKGAKAAKAPKEKEEKAPKAPKAAARCCLLSAVAAAKAKKAEAKTRCCPCSSCCGHCQPA